MEKKNSKSTFQLNLPDVTYPNRCFLSKAQSLTNISNSKSFRVPKNDKKLIKKQDNEALIEKSAVLDAEIFDQTLVKCYQTGNLFVLFVAFKFS